MLEIKKKHEYLLWFVFYELRIVLARFRRSKEEASWPRPGQNMWMSVDSQEQLDQLMANLSQSGVRESKLRRSLEKNYESLVR